MSRLTKLNMNNGFYELDEEWQKKYSDAQRSVFLVQFLGTYEDIEEEQGLDFVTALRLLSKGCYFKDEDGNVKFSDNVAISYKRVIIFYEGKQYVFQTSDYYEKWALEEHSFR